MASADEETRERVAKKGGETRARNPESLAESGRKGGEAVVEKYGPEHMAEIGEKGGESSHGGGRSNQGGGEGRGFAGMSEEKRKEIASKGGQH